MTVTQPRLSLVVPAYNEEARIGQSLKRLGEFLAGLGMPCEIILVDDGSGDSGRRAAREALDALPEAIERQFLQHGQNRGKGAAVRTGALSARGQLVAFIDADLATPPEDLLGLISALDAGADVAIGVRNQQDGSDMRDKRRLARRLAGRLYALIMKTWLLPDIEDSQCPLKAFRRGAAQRLFRLQRIDTWAFDAELLYLANRLGLTLAKIPVRWQAVPGSHLKLNFKSALEVWNLLWIRVQHRGVSTSTLAQKVEPASAP